MSNKIYVIGIGYKPLDKIAQEIIFKSGVILASNRLFEVFKKYDEFEAVKDKIKVINNVDETINFIRSQMTDDRIQSEKQSKKISFKKSLSSVLCSLSSGIVLLASGDPMFFGIGRRAVKEFGKDRVEILPDLSSIQIAFSRIKEAWDDALLISLHGGPDPEKRRRLPYEIEDLPWLIEKYPKIAILTDKENNPAKIAQALLESAALSHCPTVALKIYVCEKLGYADEKITEGTPEDIAAISFSEPNVVIIQRTGDRSQKTENRSQKTEVRFGLTEAEIAHSKGLITKDEVRAVTIHKLRLPLKGVFWDIGAGSGSISIEAARLYPDINIFAIEKDAEQIGHIIKNISALNVRNIHVIHGESPDVLSNLPSPDRIFIGGSGSRLSEIIDAISQMMPKGIVVLNATKLDTMHIAIARLKEKDFDVDAAQVLVSRMKQIGNGNYLSPLNSVFIIRGER